MGKINQKTILVAGGTGFVGKYLKTKFIELGYDVKIISRQNNSIPWTDSDSILEAIENSEMLINLAGKSVDCRYNKKNKEEILKSRTETTQLLGEILLKCKNPPELWINSSTATIYRHAQDRPMTESTGEIGSGFSVGVATQWEKVFFDFKLSKTRQVALRMAIVLGKDGGVMIPFKNLVRFGLGGKQGSGNQMFSWIHIEDLFGIIQFVQANKKMEGAYNCSAPNPVSNEILMRSLRQAMNIKFGLPSLKFLLEIGAFVIRTETELILKSRWVIPERLMKAGFQFRFSTIEEALRNILIEK
jgi:uncharacterized protein (TIGR01777 family)